MRQPVRFFVSDGPRTRLGQLMLTGELIDGEPRVESPFHSTDFYTLSVVVAGTGSYRHSDGHSDEITPGSVSIVPPNVSHWYGTAPGERWTEFFAVFHGPLFELLSSVGVIGAAGPYRPRQRPSLTTLRSLLGATPRSMRAAEYQLLGLASWLIDSLPGPADSTLSPPVDAAVNLLAGDLTGRLDLPAVARTVELPYDTFRHRFTAEVGEPPLAFRNDHRLRAAANLLRLTELTVREIATTLGYTDEFHLSKRFRAHFGMPPSRYRAMSRD